MLRTLSNLAISASRVSAGNVFAVARACSGASLRRHLLETPDLRPLQRRMLGQRLQTALYLIKTFIHGAQISMPPNQQTRQFIPQTWVDAVRQRVDHGRQFKEELGVCGQDLLEAADRLVGGAVPAFGIGRIMETSRWYRR